MDTGNYKEVFQLVVTIVVGLSGFGYGLRLMMKSLKRKKTKKNEARFNYVNMQVWNIITDLRIKAMASRVSIVQFHNGGKFMDGSSMKRMSITSQSSDSNPPPTMQFRQDVLVSRFVEIMGILQENDPKIRIVSQQKDSNTKKLYELHDTHAFSILPIYCSDSMMVLGYISVEWCDLGSLDKVDEADLHPYLENARSQIAFLLSSAKDYR